MAPHLDELDEPGAAVDDPAAAPVDDPAKDPAKDPAEDTDVPALTRFRALVVAALGPLLLGYLAIAGLLAVVTATATGAHFSTTGVLRAALPGWLAAHQVPVGILGLELGVLPLLPTVGVVAITAGTASRAAALLGLHRPGQAGRLVAIIAAVHGVAGMLVAVVVSGGAVTAAPLAALYYPALVSVLAATAGVARRCGLFDAIASRADEAAVAGLRTGALAVVLLLAAGGALLAFGLLTSIAPARALFPAGTGNAVGMLLLSLGYLPNAMIAATAFLAGPGVSIGPVTMSPVAFEGGPVPAVPLLAALPEQEAVWWPALFALPLVVGVLVGRRLRSVDDSPSARLRAVAVAAGVVAVAFVVLGGSAGGRLGRGPFDPVDLHAAAMSVALALWTAVPAAVAAWFGGPRPAAATLPGLIDDEPETLTAVEEEAPADEPDGDPDGAPEVPSPRDAVGDAGEVTRD